MPALPSLPNRLTLPSGRTVLLRVRSGSGRRIELSVTPGAVDVRVPGVGPSVSARQLKGFVSNHLDWIESTLQKYDVEKVRVGAEDVVVPCAGELLPVVWRTSAVARAEVGADEACVWVPTGAKDELARRLMRDALETKLRQAVVPLLQRWLPTIPGGAIVRLSVRDTDRQWGSMSSQRRLSLATKLVGVRPTALECVIVHELCHQLHMDHSPRFWSEVRRRFPTYLSEDAYLDRVSPKLRKLMAQWN